MNQREAKRQAAQTLAATAAAMAAEHSGRPAGRAPNSARLAQAYQEFAQELSRRGRTVADGHPVDPDQIPMFEEEQCAPISPAAKAPTAIAI